MVRCVLYHQPAYLRRRIRETHDHLYRSTSRDVGRAIHRTRVPSASRPTPPQPRPSCRRTGSSARRARCRSRQRHARRGAVEFTDSNFIYRTGIDDNPDAFASTLTRGDDGTFTVELASHQPPCDAGGRRALGRLLSKSPLIGVVGRRSVVVGPGT